MAFFCELPGKMGMIRSILPAFLSFRFLNTEMMTSRLPSTSTTVVKINTLARIPMTQAGRALPSAASARSSWPSRSSVRFLMRVNVSGITRPSTAACSRVPTVLYVLQVPPAPPRPKSNMERTWAPHELQKSALGVCRELLTCRNLKHWSHVGFCIFLCKKKPSSCHQILIGHATPSSFGKMTIICPLETTRIGRKQVHTTHISGLHPLKVSLAHWLASLRSVFMRAR